MTIDISLESLYKLNNMYVNVTCYLLIYFIVTLVNQYQVYMELGEAHTSYCVGLSNMHESQMNFRQ